MHCSKAQGKTQSPLFSAALQNRLTSRHCVTAFRPMEMCSSHRCAVTQHQCTAARFRAKCSPHCSMLLSKTGSQQAFCHCRFSYGHLLFTQVCSDPAPMHCSKLTAPPAQHATQLPAPHTPQPPAPAHSLNQPLTLAEIEVGLQHLHNGRSGALHGYTSELLRYAQLVATPDDPAPAHFALWCCSMLPSPQGRCPSPGRPPWSPQYSSMAMPQTQPTMGQSQWVSQSAGYTPTSWYGALSHTQSSSSCSLPPRQATGQSLAPSILPSPFSMLLTSTDMPTSLCTCVLWTSNQPTIRSSGSFFGACYSAWGCMATCWAPYSPCIMALCCP